MKRLLALGLGLLLALPAASRAQAPNKAAQPARIRYGANPAAAHTFMHDGVRLYYEVYGAGEPMLMIHGNGGSIADLSAQIAHFRKSYRVIAMDSRDQGRSADSPGKLTYEKMADDLDALLDHLHTGPAYILGWSDGGIEALLLGMRHPDKVKKIAAMAANLNPSDKALHPDILVLIKKTMADVPPAERNTPAGRRELKVTGMMLEEPNIPLTALEAIKAPTLVLASDHDAITDEHTVDIYHHIPNGALVIFPQAKHTIPYDDPVTFNAAVERFFRRPFVKIDRVPDTVKSLEKMHAAEAR
jgi:pimeloyl-ACP methyl ester carboxylesterase